MEPNNLNDIIVHVSDANTNALNLFSAALVQANILTSSSALVANWKKIPREIVRTRSEKFLILADQIDNEPQFIKRYRLNHAEFFWLVRTFPPVKKTYWDLRLQTMIFLDWLGSKIHIEQLAALYDMPKSTVHDTIKRIMKYVLNLKNHVIKLPTNTDELDEIAAGFSERANDDRFFKNVVGAIDGSLINLCVPEDQQEAYYDRHLNKSMNLTCICDHRMIIRFLIVGKTGACHDMNVLKSSNLYRNRLFPPRGYIILGDSAYPNTFEPISIIAPYKKSNGQVLLSEYKSNFNTAHSIVRSTIERAYGNIKTKWRRIHQNIIESKVKSAPDIIAAACILNNITLGDFHEKSERQHTVPRVNREIPFANANDYRESVARLY